MDLATDSTVVPAAPDVMLAAYAQAYRLDGRELVTYLKDALGRPLVAYIAGIADANNVSRWASGRANPDARIWNRLRSVATVHIALSAIVGSRESAAQWLTGANPRLGFKMPVDALRDGNDAEVFAAVRDFAER